MQVVTRALIVLQAAPGGEKANGVAAAAVQAVQEEATPSHDVYGHLPTPQENDKASSHLALGSCCCVPYSSGSYGCPCQLLPKFGLIRLATLAVHAVCTFTICSMSVITMEKLHSR